MIGLAPCRTGGTVSPFEGLSETSYWILMNRLLPFGLLAVPSTETMSGDPGAQTSKFLPCGKDPQNVFGDALNAHISSLSRAAL